MAIAVLFALVAAGLLGSFYYRVSAPPLEKAVALVEGSARVRETLGGPVSVSLGITKVLERDPLRAMRGQDDVRLRTHVEGPRGEAVLEVRATNVEDQGWAGTFSLEVPGRTVLRDGSYRAEGGGTLLEGTFAPDGTPIVTSNP